MQVVTYTALLLSLEASTLGFDMAANHYVGYFQENDIIVGQDNIYMAAHPFNKVKAKYGRVFPCIISYYAVEDKTKYTVLPEVNTVRGGLGQNLLSLVISSPISKPLAVTVFVACHNRKSGVSVASFSGATDSNIYFNDDFNEEEESKVEETANEVEESLGKVNGGDGTELNEVEETKTKTSAPELNEGKQKEAEEKKSEENKAEEKATETMATKEDTDTTTLEPDVDIE